MTSSDRTRDRLGAILIRRGAITASTLANALAEQFDLPRWRARTVDAAIALDLPQDLARGLPAVPFERRGDGTLCVAIADPSDDGVRESLTALLGENLELHVAAEDELLEALDQAYAAAEEPAPRVLTHQTGAPAPVDDDESEAPASASVTLESPGFAPKPPVPEDAAAATLPSEDLSDALPAAPAEGPEMGPERLSRPAPSVLSGLAPSLGGRSPGEPTVDGPPARAELVVPADGAEFASLLATLSPQAPPGTFDGLAGALVGRALAWRASTIEMIRAEDVVRIRYRVDGSWQGDLMLPRWAGDHLFDALDRHLVSSAASGPQLGRIAVRHGAHSLDLLQRSTVRGQRERRSLRLLDRKALVRTDRLGLPPDLARRVRQWTAAREGLVLVATPHDGGRSTTLYAIARELAEGRPTAIIDRFAAFPVPDATVIAREETGPLRLEAAVDAALGADPRCIVVDGVSGGSELAGLLGLATRGLLLVVGVRGIDALEALSGLRRHGVPDVLLGPQLLGVVEQRMLRLLCPQCAGREPTDPMLVNALGVVSESMPADVPVAGAGCPGCHHTGFAGRMPLFTRVELPGGVPPGIAEADLAALVDASRPVSAPTLALPLLAKGRASLREIGRAVGVRNAGTAAPPSTGPVVSVMAPGWEGTTGETTMAGTMDLDASESISLDGLPDGPDIQDGDERFRILVLERQDAVGPLLASELPPGAYRIVVADDLQQALSLAGEVQPAAIVLGVTARDQPLAWLSALRVAPECTFVPVVVVDDRSGLDPMDLLLAGADEVVDAASEAGVLGSVRALIG